MINKVVEWAKAAPADVHNGASAMLGGSGTGGRPDALIDVVECLPFDELQRVTGAPPNH